MDVLKINGRVYPVKYLGITESYTVLYSSNTGRTLSQGAEMKLDPLGTFYSHRVRVKRIKGQETAFDELFRYISKPRYDGVPVEIVHGQRTLKYDAYFSEGSRALRRVDEKTGKVIWDELEFDIIPIKAQVYPL